MPGIKPRMGHLTSQTYKLPRHHMRFIIENSERLGITRSDFIRRVLDKVVDEEMQKTGIDYFKK